MNDKEVYNWYMENGRFTTELLKRMQLECFNKPVEPVAVIDYHQLHQLMSQDKRFSDKRIVMNFLWIFDLEYAVIDKQLLLSILEQLKDVHNEWTAVAIVQSVTGLNCGFIWHGRKVVDGEITDEELSGHGYIVKDNDTISVMCFDENGKEVKEGEVVIGFAVFD